MRDSLVDFSPDDVNMVFKSFFSLPDPPTVALAHTLLHIDICTTSRRNLLHDAGIFCEFLWKQTLWKI